MSAFKWVAQTRTLTLAKMDGPLSIRWSRAFTGAPTTITVTRDPAGRSFVSFLVEEAIGILPILATAVGVDVGLKDLAALSTGEKIANPKHLARSHHRLKRAQQSLSRKAKGSKNREKARRTVARLHTQSADQRLDGLRQLTTRLSRLLTPLCSSPRA